MSQPIALTALDGSNPLGFLATLGALRLLHLRFPTHGVSLQWRSTPYWQPTILGLDLDPAALIDALVQAPLAPLAPMEPLGNNINLPPSQFAPFVHAAADAATAADRRTADFAAAFGCELSEDKKKQRVFYTDFCFITGSGHQHFLGTQRALRSKVTAAHLHDALFGDAQPQKGLAMRWDPREANQYALQWNDPGPEGAWSVWGANWLAFEALPLFPTQPSGARLRTTGFRPAERGRREVSSEFTWPLWTAPLGLDSIRSLLALDTLQQAAPDSPTLRARGIPVAFRSQRVRIGLGANFKVSFRPASAV